MQNLNQLGLFLIGKECFALSIEKAEETNTTDKKIQFDEKKEK